MGQIITGHTPITLRHTMGAKKQRPNRWAAVYEETKPTILAALDSDFAWRLVVCMLWGRVCVVIEITGIADLDGLWSWLHLELDQQQADANADEHLPAVELIGDEKNNKQQQPERDRELFHADSVKG